MIATALRTLVLMKAQGVSPIDSVLCCVRAVGVFTLRVRLVVW